jgi:ribonuclease E
MDNKTNKMLIDATHPEETRVVVLRQGRVEEFDFESASRKPLRGNIYLAKVTRVEPSLQAAFVEYGGNRHGFLAFNEIHPDYYQIPVSDRQALLDEEAAAEAEEDARADARAEARERRQAARERPARAAGDGSPRSETGPSESGREQSGDATAHADLGSEPAHYADMHPVADGHPHDAGASEARSVAEQTGLATPVVTEHHADDADHRQLRDDGHEHLHDHVGDDHIRADHIEEVPSLSDAPEIITPGAIDDMGADDEDEEQPERPRRRPRSYKIQEVIKRRQIILVQVVKEERGNKGAALTTYLSLAGRFTVLMPNTGRGGGISRKITQPQDRKRLKAIANELAVPEGMGLIIRTAGAARTKQEINRDFEYLLRLWESVRELTLESTAPNLVYEEGDLIKRSIRDLYGKDVDQVVVSGAHAYKEASDFMRMLMPSHAKNVINYQAPEPLFARYRIEPQLNAMFSPYVTLKSGGYLVINQTEALVSVDVNSGKSTREFSIEETALNTNLEASDEVARQLKLRDLAGLIVIDFIDMEERRNNRKVENRLKDALRHDRARIQVGRISHFGLMEMSRQRLRTGVLEGSTTQCPHCQGTGTIRSVESVALGVIRGLEDYLMRDARSSVTALTTSNVALYILNHKRSFIIEMENRFGVSVSVLASDKMQGANFGIEKSAEPLKPKRAPDRAAVNMESGFDGDEPVASPEDDLHDHQDHIDPEDQHDLARLDGNVEEVDQDDDGYDREPSNGGRREAQPRERGARDSDARDTNMRDSGPREGGPHESSGGDAGEGAEGEGGQRRRRRRRRGRGRDGRQGGDRPQSVEANAQGHDQGHDQRLDQADRSQVDPVTGQLVVHARDERGGYRESGEDAGRGSFVEAGVGAGVEADGSQGRDDDATDGARVEGVRSNTEGDGERGGRRRRRGRRGGRGRDRDGAPGERSEGYLASDAGEATPPREGETHLGSDHQSEPVSQHSTERPAVERPDADYQDERQREERPALNQHVAHQHEPRQAMAHTADTAIVHERVGQDSGTHAMAEVIAPKPAVIAAAPIAAVSVAKVPVDEPPAMPDDPSRPARKGWWQRKFGN